MQRSLKSAAAILSLTAPLALGWAYTAEASIGLTGDDFGHHTVDQTTHEGYTMEREDLDGNVTRSYSGPEGAALTAEELPAEIADHFDNWQPSPAPITFSLNDGIGCYAPVDGVEVDPDESEFTTVQISDDDTFVVIRNDDEAGNVGFAAIHTTEKIDESELENPDIDDLLGFPGAVEIGVCE